MNIKKESKSYFTEYKIGERILHAGAHYIPQNPHHDVIFFDTQAVPDPFRISLSNPAKDEKLYRNLSSKYLVELIRSAQSQSSVIFLPHALETTVSSSPFFNFIEFMDALHNLKDEYKTEIKQVTVSLRSGEEKKGGENNIENFYAMMRNIDIFPRIQVTFDTYDNKLALRSLLRTGLNMQLPGERLGVNILHKHDNRRVYDIFGLIGAYKDKTCVRLFFDGPKHSTYVGQALAMYEKLGMHVVVAQHP